MGTSPIIVLFYILFESYLLSCYGYSMLSYHSIYISFLHIYLSIRSQPLTYNIERWRAQKQNMQKSEENLELKTCLICKRIKPSRYYHCRRCNVCIYRMDHHCQWISNCMGHFNARPFLHYLIHMFAHNLLIILNLFVFNLMNILTNHDRSIYLLILLIPLAFILFETQRLLRDFYHMVNKNQTLIESYKLVIGPKLTFKQSLNSFLGTDNALLYFLPFYLPSQKSYQKANLLEFTAKVEQNSSQPEELTYADEYLYGKDDQDQNYLVKQAKYE